MILRSHSIISFSIQLALSRFPALEMTRRKLTGIKKESFQSKKRQFSDCTRNQEIWALQYEMKYSLNLQLVFQVLGLGIERCGLDFGSFSANRSAIWNLCLPVCVQRCGSFVQSTRDFAGCNCKTLQIYSTWQTSDLSFNLFFFVSYKRIHVTQLNVLRRRRKNNSIFCSAVDIQMTESVL